MYENTKTERKECSRYFIFFYAEILQPEMQNRTQIGKDLLLSTLMAVGFIYNFS